MSQFFKHYDSKEVARIYDRERYPVGADAVAGLLHIHCRKALEVCYKRFSLLVSFSLFIYMLNLSSVQGISIQFDFFHRVELI